VTDLDPALRAITEVDVGEVYGEAPIWLNKEVGTVLDGIAHHQYAFVSGDMQRRMVDFTTRLSGGTPAWATEVCCAPVNSIQELTHMTLSRL